MANKSGKGEKSAAGSHVVKGNRTTGVAGVKPNRAKGESLGKSITHGTADPWEVRPEVDIEAPTQAKVTVRAGGKLASRTPLPVTVEVRVRLQALAVPEPGGGYSVVVPALPGCVTEGETIEEVQANVVEAAEGWLKSQYDHRREDSLRLVRE